MRSYVLAAGLAASLVTVAVAQQGAQPAPGQPPSSSSSATARAQMMDGQGRSIGTAELRETPNGLLLQVTLKNATAGEHGLHVHAVGRCEGPTFQTAGGHFNPSGKKHGFLSDAGPHAGDLPNIMVPASMQATAELMLPGLTLSRGPNAVLDADGAALVMHAGKDDHVTDPAGASGDRIACGVITSGAAAPSAGGK